MAVQRLMAVVIRSVESSRQLIMESENFSMSSGGR